MALKTCTVFPTVVARAWFCLQALPNVMDIEANPETGEWRIAGSQGAWMHIRDDPAKVLDSSVVIKPEPQLSAAAPVAAAQGGHLPPSCSADKYHQICRTCFTIGPSKTTIKLINALAHPCLLPNSAPSECCQGDVSCDAGGGSDSDEELSEGEELRQAAAAAAAHSKRGAAAKEDEVIVLSDSDDDDRPAPPLPPPPPPQQHRSAAALHAPHRPGGSQPAKGLAQPPPPRLAYPTAQRPMPASVQPSSSAVAGQASSHLQVRPRVCYTSANLMHMPS